MKSLMGLFVLLAISAVSVADTTGVTADGGLFYKNDKGELAKQEAKLFVPAKGEGKVQLIIGEEKIDAAKFLVQKAHGRTVFNVAFVNPPHAPKNSVALLTGTYARGTNVAVYYGDIYLQSTAPGQEEDAIDALLKKKKKGEPVWIGGFGFKATVPAEE